jgi:hypothetical protein
LNSEGHTLALVDDRWLLAAEDDFGVISKVDLQTGVRTPLGHAATNGTLTGLTQSSGPWLELGLFSDRQEVWLINRKTARVDVIEGSHRIVPSPDGQFIAYEVREETERLVSVAPVTDPTDAHAVRAGNLIAWLPG